MFRTAAAVIAFAVVIVPVTVLLGDGAFADGGRYSTSSSTNFHNNAGCGSEYWIDHGDSDCMHAWWDNTPPASTGVAIGSTFGVRSYCSQYGDMKVNVDKTHNPDEHFHLDDDSKRRGRFIFSDVGEISCCINNSDICIKQQVEKRNGKIKVWSGTGTTMETVNVRTHAKRYAYCSEYPDSIYCVNDPDGDAFIDPYNCGDHVCTVDDCQSAFEASDGYEQCQGDWATEVADPTYSISATDGSSQTCTVTANCARRVMGTSSNGVVNYNYTEKTISADVEDIYDVVNCLSPQLAVGAC